MESELPSTGPRPVEIPAIDFSPAASAAGRISRLVRHSLGDGGSLGEG